MSDFFEVHEVTPRVTRITDVADTHFYLVRGEHDAALLDTGVGCGDLKALVSKLTDLPVTVLITHGHVDHAFGAGQFERAYMSPLDRELYAEHGQPETRLEYIHHSAGADTSPKAVAVTEAQLQPPKPFENFFPLTPGDRFDLGGLSVEIHEGRGHTPGCVTMLLPEERIVLTGDACNPFTFLFDESCSTVAEYRELLLRLQTELDGRYDRILLNHGPGGEASSDLIGNVIAVCDDILAGNVDNEPFQGFHGETVCIAKAMKFENGNFSRTDGLEGNVVYNPNRIR